jgi:hypothetical protein
MKFALLMTADYEQWRSLSPEQSEAVERQVQGFNEELTSNGVLISTEGLDEPARHVHFHHGTPDVQDGPVTAAAEQLAALWIIDVANLDAAIEWARKAPVTDGAVEVRPVA